MPTVWDTAQMLIAMAGAEEAQAAARGLAAEAEAARRARESAYWHQVAAAVAWISNPQPLIAPELPPAPDDVVHAFADHPRAPRRAQAAGGGKTAPRVTGAKIHTLARAAAKLPTRRASLLDLKKKLRSVWKRHHGPARPARGPRIPKRPGRG